MTSEIYSVLTQSNPTSNEIIGEKWTQLLNRTGRCQFQRMKLDMQFLPESNTPGMDIILRYLLRFCRMSSALHFSHSILQSVFITTCYL